MVCAILTIRGKQSWVQLPWPFPNAEVQAAAHADTGALSDSLFLQLKQSRPCIAPSDHPHLPLPGPNRLVLPFTNLKCPGAKWWALTKRVPYFAGCCWGSPITVSTLWWWTSTEWTRNAILSQQRQPSSLHLLTIFPWEKKRWNCKQKLVSHVPNSGLQGLQLSVNFF